HDHVDRVSVPETIRDAIAARLEQLDERSRRVLDLGSVIGNSFDVDLVARAVDLTHDDVRTALTPAVQLRLLEPTPDHARDRFRHALTWVALVNELDDDTQRQLHGRVAETLEELRPQSYALIADHYSRSTANDAVTRSAGFRLRAARDCLTRFAVDDALELCE